MLMVVNDVVFSMEVWDWYHNRKDKLKMENNIPINVFRPWLKEHHQNGIDKVSTYGELTGWDFLELINELLMIYTDIHERPLGDHVTMEQQYIELSAIETSLIYWVFTEGHAKEDFGPDMRNEYLDSNRMAFNQKFHVEMCYTMKAIWQGYHDLKKLLNGKEITDLDILNILTMENYEEDEVVDEFIKKVIRQAYGGDFDEFIIAVMERIKFQTMKENHEKLAKIKAYELFGKEDFEKMLPEYEIWRMLYNNYFDEVEDIYKLFYQKFLGHCIQYVLLDYLSWDSEDSGIYYIPVYKYYCDKELTEATQNIRLLIDMEKIRARIKKLYKIRIK